MRWQWSDLLLRRLRPAPDIPQRDRSLHKPARWWMHSRPARTTRFPRSSALLPGRRAILVALVAVAAPLIGVGLQQVHLGAAPQQLAGPPAPPAPGLAPRWATAS